MTFKLWLEAKLGIEAAPHILQSLGSIRSNLYHRTRPFRPNTVGNRNTPMDELRYWRAKIVNIKEWIERAQFPVTLRHIDGAISALADAMIDLHQNPDPQFTSASYGKGADPKNAETLQQFSTFLQKRVAQKPIPHKILERTAEEFDAFIEDFVAVYKRLKESGEIREDI